MVFHWFASPSSYPTHIAYLWACSLIIVSELLNDCPTILALQKSVYLRYEQFVAKQKGWFQTNFHESMNGLDYCCFLKIMRVLTKFRSIDFHRLRSQPIYKTFCLVGSCPTILQENTTPYSLLLSLSHRDISISMLSHHYQH